MKIVDTFPFSEPYEADLLWVKLNIEAAVVDEWVIVENAYSFQGEPKGVWAESIVTGDDRFAPFRNRIRIMQDDFKPEAVYNRDGIHDPLAFRAENAQRELARAYVLEAFGDDDYVLISDVDEMLDAARADKKALLLDKINRDTTGIVRIPRTRFWFDFDNRWLMHRATPLVSIKALRDDPRMMGDIRRDTISPVKRWPQALLFEYSFCTPFDEIIRKCSTQSHTGMRADELKRSVLCNHIPVSSLRNVEISIHPRFWLETIALDEANSPRFVRDNLAALKTHVVAPDYRKNRQTYYPHLFPAKGYRRFLTRMRKNLLLKQARLFENHPGVKRWYRSVMRYLDPLSR